MVSSGDGEGRQTESIDFSKSFILDAEVNLKGVAVYKTNAKYDESGVVETRWIHKIEFILERKEL